MLQIRSVTLQDGLNDFIEFPHHLLKDDPYYVPELFIAQKELFTKHPFHEHSSVQCFLVYYGTEIVGHIAAILNVRHNQFN